MSQNQSRLMYDDTVYTEAVKQSTGALGYMLNPIRYVNCRKCRVEQGLVQGQDVSILPGNIVDTESDLSGRTRLNSKYDVAAYQPRCAKAAGRCVTDSGIPYDCDECQPDKRHLKACNIVDHRPKFAGPGYTLPRSACGSSGGYGPPAGHGTPVQAHASSRPWVASAWQGNAGE